MVCRHQSIEHRSCSSMHSRLFRPTGADQSPKKTCAICSVSFGSIKQRSYLVFQKFLVCELRASGKIRLIILLLLLMLFMSFLQSFYCCSDGNTLIRCAMLCAMLCYAITAMLSLLCYHCYAMMCRISTNSYLKTV